MTAPTVREEGEPKVEQIVLTARELRAAREAIRGVNSREIVSIASSPVDVDRAIFLTWWADNEVHGAVMVNGRLIPTPEEDGDE